MSNNVSYTDDPLKGSLCYRCKYRASREILPFNEADFGIDRKAMGISEDEEVIVEHHMCIELGIDLDHIVLKCDHFCEKCDKHSFISDKFYKA